MHFSMIVAVPERDKEMLTRLLAPFDENYEHTCPRNEGNDWEADCATCERSFWDWWQLGGRWTGFWDGYEPEDDPTNREICLVCGGTGKRDWSGITMENKEAWIAKCNGCNGCKGTGWSTTWPTQWPERDQDWATQEQALAHLRAGGQRAYKALLGEVLLESETYNPNWRNDGTEAFIKHPDYSDRLIEEIGKMPNCWFAIVDYHS